MSLEQGVSEKTQFPYAKSAAALMLAEALERAASDRNLSRRSLAKVLGYKQGVVLSHMASGRSPIPVDRAAELAGHLRMDAGQFVLAVLEQRHPDVNFRTLVGGQPDRSSEASRDDAFIQDLMAIAGCRLSELPSEHRRVIKEVIAERHPAR